MRSILFFCCLFNYSLWGQQSGSFEVAMIGYFAGSNIPAEKMMTATQIDLLESKRRSTSVIVGFDVVFLDKGRVCPAAPVINIGATFSQQLLDRIRSMRQFNGYELRISNIVINKPDGTLMTLDNEFRFKVLPTH